MNTIDAAYEEAEAEVMAAHTSLRKASRNVLHIREELAGNLHKFNGVGHHFGADGLASRKKLQELLDEAESKELEAEENWMLACQHLEEIEANIEDEQF